MPTSAPGRDGGERRRRPAGFTLIELLVVVAIIAIASGVAALSLRDGDSARLDEEAERLAALLEGARAEARAAGVRTRWETAQDGAAFRFAGAPTRADRPSRWLHEGTVGGVVGARAVVLGPEPLIGPQRIELQRGERRLVIATDGLGPFAVEAAP
jgi:general secretion pathway protein H